MLAVESDLGRGPLPTNDEIADALDQVADLLEAQDANRYRVRAYREGARTVRAHPVPVALLVRDGGRAALDALRGIGQSLSAAIEELVQTGRLALLERLMGQVSPEDLFTIVPGIGEELAARIHDTLGVETLEELELAAHDGRLERVDGFGHRRARAVRDALDAILSRSSRRRSRLVRAAASGQGDLFVDAPMVASLLDVDREYRQLAEAGRLRKIAPRRFNPRGEAWLPILHTERDGWTITAIYSNSARAHALGKTRDWVVLFYERDGHEGQCTVVTEYRGRRAGTRVVRGRESESRRS
ncbi:MAG: DNA-binding protein [Candidatus Latescibacterota bacterium]|nr:MAG: DNA-binding protein [Candidatus Latescibacterota bacterium]